MMKRTIEKVAILGSGIMGSRIACHFANIGVEVLLLDIVPTELNEAEKDKKLKISDPQVRNRIVIDALDAAIKSNPEPLYQNDFANLISTGNLEDDLSRIEDVDWILEAVIEDIKIKHSVFEQVEKHRKDGTIVTTNTSGIPVHLMLQGRSEDFQKHFAGTHFFNPPRYLQLLEIIPTEKTDPEIVEFLTHFGDLYLGKTTVICKDTPAFIANRIGIYSIMEISHLMEKYKFSVEQIDALTGPIVGRPKSATFRTCDLVGIDTLAKVASDLYENCKNDESREMYLLPAYMKKLIEKKWFGDKTKQGFYKKIKGKDGKSEILALDINTFEYKPKQKVRFEGLQIVKSIGDLKKRITAIHSGTDESSVFFNDLLYGLLAYVSHRIPEISNETYKIDDALYAGFGWELGPFATWDLLGVEKTLKKMEKEGRKPAKWVYDMIDNGAPSFYKVEKGIRQYYNVEKKKYEEIPGKRDLILLDNYTGDKIVWENEGCTLFDIGDGILNLEFHTKMNTIGGEVLEGINYAINKGEEEFNGLVIGNEGLHFSAGANLAMMFMLATEQEFDEMDLAIRTFQNAMMRMRYSSIPVVVAPHGLALGGGCELVLHADAVQAAAETYIGLVEVGVGLIPSGGGTKEMVLRASDEYEAGDIELATLQQAFLNIATAKVATSAHQAFDIGLFSKGKDHITLNKSRLLLDAKKQAMSLAEKGYQKPIERKDIKVLGRTSLALFLTGLNAYYTAKYISEHDKKVTEKLAFVMSGGDLSESTLVSETYLLDLEREAFLSLLGEQKTLERIQSVLKTGKPVRN